LWAVANVHGLLARPEWRLFQYDAAIAASQRLVVAGFSCGS
jgi:hypothetical protein